MGAESVTKADEYAKPTTAVAEEEVFHMLLCRVVGGRVTVHTDKEINTDELKELSSESPTGSLWFMTITRYSQNSLSNTPASSGHRSLNGAGLKLFFAALPKVRAM